MEARGRGNADRMVFPDPWPLTPDPQDVRRCTMSWLSKWWRSGGREDLEKQIRELLLGKFKKQVATRLRVLLAALDGMDVQAIKGELGRLIIEVEAW